MDVRGRRESTPPCDICQSRKRKCDGILPRCTNCFAHDLKCSYSFTNENNVYSAPNIPLPVPTGEFRVRRSMDGLVAPGFDATQLPKPFGYENYVAAEADRLASHLPEDVYEGVKPKKVDNAFHQALLAAHAIKMPPPPSTQAYEDPILVHNPNFRWKSLFPAEVEIPESIKGDDSDEDANGDPLDDDDGSTKQVEAHLSRIRDVWHSSASPPEERSYYHEEPREEPKADKVLVGDEYPGYSSGWEEIYSWPKGAMAVPPFASGIQHVNMIPHVAGLPGLQRVNSIPRTNSAPRVAGSYPNGQLYGAHFAESHI